MEEGGWTTVRRRSRSQRGNSSRALHAIPYRSHAVAQREPRRPPLDFTREKVRIAIEKLDSCPWWLAARQALLLQQKPKFGVQFVALGLGSFVASSNARLQLALAFVLHRDTLDTGGGNVSEQPIIADPAMSFEDEALAIELGFSVAHSVADAIRQFTRSTQDPTCAADRLALLLLMPHCERHLYNTVLDLCWGPTLERVTIFGNSFKMFYRAGEGPRASWSFMDAVVADGVAIETPCLDAAHSLSYEAFNDLAVVRFDASQARTTSDEFWRWRPCATSGDDKPC
jgi:SRR1